ncbi:MAG: hypothetical protein DMF87_07040 [Acidobacteria bacterium]|nr:MAG: hypothetical protein DMF88_14615 [Acidobacteriota bacterium]PYR80985.1 MAG: hypothetical protein DMF87_07040 [Acidobacteriota bacterium]
MVGIENALEHDRDQLQGRIEESVREVRRAARRYRRISTALLLTGMLCGAVSTALAGDAFRGGSLAAKTAEATTGRVPAELARGWRNLCGIIAVLTLAGTLATGTNSVLKLAEHQSQTRTCLAALGALNTQLFEEAAASPVALAKAKSAFESIRLQYDEYFP